MMIYLVSIITFLAGYYLGGWIDRKFRKEEMMAFDDEVTKELGARMVETVLRATTPRRPFDSFYVGTDELYGPVLYIYHTDRAARNLERMPEYGRC